MAAVKERRLTMLAGSLLAARISSAAMTPLSAGTPLACNQARPPGSFDRSSI